MRKSTKGFTLTEVMITIIIIGILAAVALPRFGRKTEKALVAEAATILDAMRQCEMAYELEHRGSYLALSAGSANWATIGLGEPTGGAFDYTFNGTANGLLTATRNATHNATAGCSPRVNGCNGTTVTLTVADPPAWGGDHPNRPR